LTPSGSGTVHRIQRRNIHNNQKLTNLGSTGRAPSLTSYTLVFALQLRKKHGQTSVMVASRTSQTNTVQYTSNENDGESLLTALVKGKGRSSGSYTARKPDGLLYP
jgi:hypothetical protein